ncbi:AAI domain-containing protein [Citrus sinensis]|nr:AAI domain-containing protein [Citrus sinensis]
MGIVLVLVAMLCGGAKGQMVCTGALTSLAPCLNYVSGNSSNPSPSCCSQLRSVVQSSPQCLCSVLNGGVPSLGITINQTLALSLPRACQVQTPPISQCKAAANGPATSPASSPASSPARNGSKTVPTTGGTSDGSIVRAPFNFVLLLIFIASRASTIINF